MNYLIDTNICIYLMNGRTPQLVEKVLEKSKLAAVQSIAISSITVAELQYGVANSKKKAQNQTRLNAFLLPFDILPFTESHTECYGEIRAQLTQKGNIIGPLDLLIAAHALAENRTLVTNNDKEFVRVKGLTVENWLM